MTRLTTYKAVGAKADPHSSAAETKQTHGGVALSCPSYFDVAAEEYAAWYHQTRHPLGYALHVRQQRVLEMLDQPGGRLLDVGCGPANIARYLLQAGYEFWGIDAAPRMIELCRRQYAGVERTHFSIGDATSLSFKDEFFDAAICMGVLDRVQSHEKALREMLRVVKPNGTLVITFPNLFSPYAAWKNYVYYPAVALVRPVYYGLRRRPQPPSLYSATGRAKLREVLTSFANMQTVQSFATFMQKNGAQVTDVTYSNFNIFLSPLDEVMPGLALRVIWRMEGLRNSPLRWLGAGFIFKVKKIS